MATQKRSRVHYLQNLAIRAILGAALTLPYKGRVRFMGWVMSHIVAPSVGWRKRIRDNLALIHPDMPASQVNRLTRQVPNNVGRSLIEIYSGEAFRARVQDTPFQGAGVKALLDAKEQQRPVILVTGHFGNYDAPRAALVAKGYPVGGL